MQADDSAVSDVYVCMYVYVCVCKFIKSTLDHESRAFLSSIPSRSDGTLQIQRKTIASTYIPVRGDASNSKESDSKHVHPLKRIGIRFKSSFGACRL